MLRNIGGAVTRIGRRAAQRERYVSLSTLKQWPNIGGGQESENNLPGEFQTQYKVGQEKVQVKDIRIEQGSGRLHLNFEDVNFADIPQDALVKQLHETITAEVVSSKPATVSFSHIPESLYFTDLRIRMHRLGYRSYFQRFNDDHGRAVFYMEESSGQPHSRAVYFSGLPNPC
ncbi:hypothetical protein CHS0354_028773 [Potamilus streckersoni]|uniref:Uncharacterized protein n=1 Tax=Potamilus streckersoni TaxID=2493646 RepID=A0AAE0S8Q1_9BIVA|nr:hypothetical protein CHS0354_028773 [Potamilus streckersoni]